MSQANESNQFLSDAQIQFYKENGYLVLENFVSTEKCDALKKRISEIIAATDPKEVGGIFMAGSEQLKKVRNDYFLSSADKIRLFLEAHAVNERGEVTVPMELAINKIGHALHSLDPVFSEFSHSETLRQISKDIGLQDALIPQSMYIFKQPRIGGEVTPHQDSTFLYTEPLSCTAFWFALDDATKENGCLWAIPKSHKGPVHRRMKLNNTRDGVYFDPPIENDACTDIWPEADYVPIEVKRGTLVIMHGSLVHKSAPNLSDQPRHAYTLHIIDGRSVWDKDNWLQYPDGKRFQAL